MLTRRQLLTSFCFTLLSGCSPSPDQYEHHFIVFGTQVNVSLWHPSSSVAQQAIQKIEQRFYQFHQDWHAWEQGGIISKVNRAIAEQRPYPIPTDLADFILKSQQLAAQSDYLFDPGIGQLIALWGFHSEDWQGPPPSTEQIQNWLNTRPSIAHLQINNGQLTSTNQTVSLDFGGNAKGLALDIAINTLKQAGITNAVVNIGGDMRVIGSKQGQPWRMGIQDPFSSQKILASVELSGDESLVTSGSYQRYFEWQGQTFSHILNPNTGYPAQNFVSVTVLHPDATTADAAATALMIAGESGWQKIAQQMGIEFALMINEKGKTFTTKQMANRLKML